MAGPSTIPGFSATSRGRRVHLDDLAVELAASAHRQAVEQDLPWGRARAALRLALALGPGAEGDPLLAEALAVTEEEGFVGLWSRRERADAGEALAWALDAASVDRPPPPGSPPHAACVSGGADEDWNTAPLCRACHVIKGAIRALRRHSQGRSARAHETAA